MATRKVPSLDGSGRIFEKHVPSRLSDASLTATYLDKASGLTKATAVATYAPRVSDRIVLLGNSRLARENGSVAQGTVGYWMTESRGFFAWANALAGAPFNVVNQAGISGDQLGNMITRWNTDVAPYAPSWVFIADHINDLNTRTYDQILADYTILFNLAAGINARVICTTSPPKSTLDAATALKNEQINRWLLNITTPGIHVVNVASGVTDPTTGQWITGMDDEADGLHQSPIGALRMGRILAPALATLMPPKDRFPSTILDTGNGVTNPFNAGAPGSGVPTGYTTSGVGTYTMIARTDLYAGNLIENTLTAVANGEVRQILTALPSGFAVGDKIKLISEVFVTSVTELQSLTATVNLNNSAGTRQASAETMRLVKTTGLGTTVGDLPAGQRLILESPAAPIPATVDRWTFTRRFRGIGTVRWGRSAIVKV